MTANDCSIKGDLISSKILLHRAGSIGSFKMFCIEKEVWFMSLKLKLSILLNLIISDFYRNLFNYFTSLNLYRDPKTNILPKSTHKFKYSGKFM